MPSIIMTSTCDQPVVIIARPSYTMTAQNKSNIGCASFTCVVVDLLLCKTNIPAEYTM